MSALCRGKVNPHGCRTMEGAFSHCKLTDVLRIGPLQVSDEKREFSEITSHINLYSGNFNGDISDCFDRRQLHDMCLLRVCCFFLG